VRERTGSVYQQSSGRWSVKVTGADGRRTTICTVDTEAEARRALTVAVRLVARQPREANEETLATWGARWLETRKTMRSFASMRRVWEARIATAPFAGRSLKSLRRSDVLGWVRGMDGARSTKQNALNLLRKCLADALDERKIRENPAADVRVPREPRARDAWTYLTPAELDAVMALADEDDRDVIAFAAGTGLRAGELCALEVCDVVLGTEPHVVVRYGGRGGRATKSGKPRVVPLFGWALDAILRWRQRHPPDPSRPHAPALPSLRGGSPLGGPRVRVGQARSHFHVLGRDHVGGGEYVDRFRALCELAGLFEADPERPLSWHSLRHTCATSLVSGAWGRAWSLREVQELLGHVQASTTERYAHLCGTLVGRAAAAHRAIVLESSLANGAPRKQG